MTRAELLELYKKRLDARAADKASRRQSLNAVAVVRVVVFFLGVFVLWLVWETDVLGWPWLALPVSAFFFFVNLHSRLQEVFRKSERVEAFYTKGIERLEERWHGRGAAGEGYVGPGHPYARDLDLFGRGSVFELLATTQSPWGEARLADWLAKAAPAAEVRLRQEAVQELAPKLELREAIAGERAPGNETVDAEALSKWATSPPVLTARWLRPVTLVLGLVTTALLIAWLASAISRLPALAFILVSGLVGLWLRARVLSVIQGVERPARELTVLSVLLERFEEEPFESEKLRALQSILTAKGERASVRIRQLNRLIDYLDARRNQIFAPIAALVFWGTQFAYALESWRDRAGGAVPQWLDAVAELDALLALGAYAHEHPDDTYPEIVEDEGEGQARFEATALGHPLIPGERLVRNDVAIGDELRLIVISGSNMSGKSTLLRSIGVATAMGLAGAPVRAGKLVLSPLAVAASIRIEDSLQEGISHFYAEILRLRQVMDLASDGETETVLFLLDEILHGTNSHDRRIGAEAVVRGLVEKGAIGLITTHDLALSKLAETMGEKATNVHFEDQIEDGKIRFDYVMRDGVVKKSNALALMRSIGLKV